MMHPKRAMILAPTPHRIAAIVLFIILMSLSNMLVWWHADRYDTRHNSPVGTGGFGVSPQSLMSEEDAEFADWAAAIVITELFALMVLSAGLVFGVALPIAVEHHLRNGGQPHPKGASQLMSKAPTPSTRQGKPLMVKLGVPLTVLVGITFVVLSFWRDDPSHTPKPTGASEAQAAPGNEPPGNARAERPEPKDDARALRAKAQRDVFKNECQQLMAAFDEFEATILDWNTETEAAKTSDSGRSLATDPQKTEMFYVLMHDALPSPDEVLVDRTTFDVECSVADMATPDSTYSPSSASIKSVQDQRKTLKNITGDYAQALSRLRALLASATAPPGTKTLQQELDEFEQGIRLAELEKRRHEVAKARKEAADKTAQAEADKERRIGDIEARAIRDEAAELEKKAEQKRLRERADDPTIKAQFQPFLTPGKNRVGMGILEHSARKQPASLSDLRKAMVDFETFSQCGAGVHALCNNNDRPRWPLPQTNEQWDEAEARYKLFLELAPLWVESGDLMP